MNKMETSKKISRTYKVLDQGSWCGYIIYLGMIWHCFFLCFWTWISPIRTICSGCSITELTFWYPNWMGFIRDLLKSMFACSSPNSTSRQDWTIELPSYLFKSPSINLSHNLWTCWKWKLLLRHLRERSG